MKHSNIEMDVHLYPVDRMLKDKHFLKRINEVHSILKLIEIDNFICESNTLKLFHKVKDLTVN